MKQSSTIRDEATAQQPAAQRKSGGSERDAEIAHSPAMTAQRKKLESMFGAPAQRMEEEEPKQARFATAQRMEEEEPKQAKSVTAQRVEEEEPKQAKFAANATAQRKADDAAPNRTGLPDNLKSGVESLSGMSLDHVKVHYNSAAPASLQAHAYAQGSDIHVAPGQEQHLPHEAWHVVQQAQGRVKPTMQMKEGVAVNNDSHLEHEADVMGAKALQMAPDHDTEQ
jgi:hypothetical protein